MINESSDYWQELKEWKNIFHNRNVGNMDPQLAKRLALMAINRTKEEADPRKLSEPQLENIIEQSQKAEEIRKKVIQFTNDNIKTLKGVHMQSQLSDERRDAAAMMIAMDPETSELWEKSTDTEKNSLIEQSSEINMKKIDSLMKAGLMGMIAGKSIREIAGMYPAAMSSRSPSDDIYKKITTSIKELKTKDDKKGGISNTAQQAERYKEMRKRQQQMLAEQQKERQNATRAKRKTGGIRSAVTPSVGKVAGFFGLTAGGIILAGLFLV